MTKEPPPLILESARVLAYACVDDIPYQRGGALYPRDTLIEQVPRLAIGIHLGQDVGPLLFHCDDGWNVLACSGVESGAGTVEAIKAMAEKNYPGVAARWVDLATSVEDAIRYFDEQGGQKCSFCGRRAFELRSLVVGKGVAICNFCIHDFRETRATQDDEPPP